MGYVLPPRKAPEAPEAQVDSDPGPQPDRLLIVALAIILAAAIVAGTLVYLANEERERDKACADWQAAYRTFAEIAGEEAAMNTLEHRPEGCPIP